MQCTTSHLLARTAVQLDPITSLPTGCVLYDMQPDYLLTDHSLHVLGLASVGPIKIVYRHCSIVSTALAIAVLVGMSGAQTTMSGLSNRACKQSACSVAVVLESAVQNPTS